ncbi:unnamed protein product [Meganyctiphanes norvegica]|uniref:Uncharacterized protein n=1 Tax=Meganyctiphanes norvegica TaxID=48144 RepID=A0AAV2PH83_MEGNR
MVNGVTTGWCKYDDKGKSAIIYFKEKDGNLKILDVDGDEIADPMKALNTCQQKTEKENQMAMQAHGRQMQILNRDMHNMQRNMAQNMNNMQRNMNNMFQNMFGGFGR